MARRSMGGTVVESSLRSVGFEPSKYAVALVETASPRRSGYDTVLAQNAWNVIALSTFRRLAAPYPKRMVARMVARRRLALWNLRHARRVVCLSDSMADLVRPWVGFDPVVSKVTLPLDVVDAEDAVKVKEMEALSLLIPGSVTWYKAPQEAIPVALHLREETGRPVHLEFAGVDDGSGCSNAIVHLAESDGLPAKVGPLGRAEMLQSIKSADLVVIPSRLESLGFALAEAQYLGRSVMARRLPSHLELAGRLPGSVRWLDEGAQEVSSRPPEQVVSAAGVRAEWRALARTLSASHRGEERVCTS